MNGAYSTTDTVHDLIKVGVGGRGDLVEALAWAGVERFLLHILIEVAIIQVNTLGADEE